MIYDVRLKPHQVNPVDDSGATVADGGYAFRVVSGSVQLVANRHEIIYTIPGATAGVAGPVLYNDTGQPWTIRSARLVLKTAAASGTTRVDVKINGSSIFSADANKPQITGTGSTNKSTTIATNTVNDGDYLSGHLDLIGSGADTAVIVLVVD